MAEVRLEQRLLERALTLRPGEVENLLEAVTGDDAGAARDRALLELLYATGLRVAELVGLDWEDVDLKGRVLRALGKGGKERMVPFGRPAAEALRAWRERRAELPRPDSAPLFVNLRGERLTDNGFHPMAGLSSVNTPTLTGIGASAPYLHDGSARTLADVVEQADAIGMGRTSHLTAAERSDLVAYLRSL